MSRLLDIAMVEADTPERLALIAILHDVDDALEGAVGPQSALLNIKRNAEVALREGSRH